MTEPNQLSNPETEQNTPDEFGNLLTSLGHVIASSPVLLKKYEKMLEHMQFAVRLENNLNPHQVIVDDHELKLLVQLRKYSFDDIESITRILQSSAQVLIKTYESDVDDVPIETVRRMQRTAVELSHLSYLIKNTNSEWRAKLERVQEEVMPDA